jgi:EAL domain-containing protein (putative c-di-GMP-specific phosphodiesterase class I)
VLPRQADTATIRSILAEAPLLACAPAGVPRPGGLMLRYQPVVCLRTRRIVMVEALARWASDPVALPPVNFVPAMERMGLGQALATAVTRIATQDLARLRLRPVIAVSVNLGVAEGLAPGLGRLAWAGDAPGPAAPAPGWLSR